MREIITMQCNDCKKRNCSTTKNKKKHQDRLESGHTVGAGTVTDVIQ